MRSADQIVQGEVERLGQLAQRVDRAFPAARLDLRQEGLRNPRLLGKRLGGQPAVLAPDPDSVRAAEQALDDLGGNELFLGCSTRLTRSTSWPI
ncbi:hypothetical protein [Methylobacterium nodulans]|uniref:hypothetical protein n=1 Tax=Methylobacterium nodulans TaxID=114616 RepID=UPI003CC76EEB